MPSSGFHAREREGRPQADPEATLTDLLSEYEWRAAVVAYRYFEGPPSAQAQPVFVGEIIAIDGDEKETRRRRQVVVEAAVPNVQITKGRIRRRRALAREVDPGAIGSKADRRTARRSARCMDRAGPRSTRFPRRVVAGAGDPDEHGA